MKIDVLKKQLQPLFKKYKIEKAVLFGSLVRDDMSRRSDVDLILIQETQKRFLDCYKERSFIRQALRQGITLYEHTQKAR